ncbi:bZIP transcription factor [Aspergillus puulaauensis]|uniref:BZIP domain-containing protein n=1 Tax=Aspergillus puulaauensis TaxID=1220207 RepID=A0A7R8ANA5_9EURO|nr:uncharacterized protein APUU_41670S [Aspergillus puulaauensis]BCS25226.1 hypothetical protein APUU_41670S [Aspergillus puulaauensis]
MPESKYGTSGSRKRGRPRRVIDDEQVPERRRKQVRVAQQAFRARKETTINNLQTRVHVLEAGIEELSQSFLLFSDILLQDGVIRNHPHLAPSLHKITKQYVSLAAHGCDDADLPALDEISTDTDDNGGAMTNINLGFDPGAASIYPPSFNEDSIESLLSLTQWPETQLPATPPYQEQSMLPFGLILPNRSPTIDAPVPTVPSPLATILPSGLARKGHWTLSHRIVRECCACVYRLLVNTPNDVTEIQRLFGHQLTSAECNRLISAFYRLMQDEVGDLVELRTQVLDPLRSTVGAWSPDQIQKYYRARQLMSEFGPDEWLDASGVQKLLQQKGISILESHSPHSSLRVDAPLSIDMTAFIRCLSLCGVCANSGPVFRKRDVENALRLASSSGVWPFETQYYVP